MVPARVECHSGYRADERPERFSFGAERHDVREVLDRWRTPAEEGFRVRATCGRVFVLRLDTYRGEWTVAFSERSVSSRRGGIHSRRTAR